MVIVWLYRLLVIRITIVAVMLGRFKWKVISHQAARVSVQGAEVGVGRNRVSTSVEVLTGFGNQRPVDLPALAVGLPETLGWFLFAVVHCSMYLKWQYTYTTTITRFLKITVFVVSTGPPCATSKWAVCDGSPCSCTVLVDDGVKKALDCKKCECLFFFFFCKSSIISVLVRIGSWHILYHLSLFKVV